MDKETTLACILSIFILLVSVKMFLDSDFFNLKCVVSSVDGNKYCVREREKLTLVVDLFARISQNMSKLVEHLNRKYPSKDNVKRLVQKFNPKKN